MATAQIGNTTEPFRLNGTERFALYHPGMGWLVDTCAGGAFDWNVAQATWYRSETEAYDALRGAEISTVAFSCVIVSREDGGGG